jgi:hypothetical protein
VGYQPFWRKVALIIAHSIAGKQAYVEELAVSATQISTG